MTFAVDDFRAKISMDRVVDIANGFNKRLRRMPPFATTHTFCASRDGPRNFGTIKDH